MATCFCAVEEVSIIPGRLWTYAGYNCTDGTVSAVNVNQSFTTNPNITSFAPGMPNASESCNCNDECCRQITLVTTTTQRMSLAGAKADAAGSSTDLEGYPCSGHLLINPKLEILGRWRAHVTLQQPGVLHLVLFGSRNRCHYRVYGHAYFFVYQCLGDEAGCCLDEDCLEFTDGHRQVWIGTVSGQRVGPFAVIRVLPGEEDEVEEARRTGAGPAGAARK